MHLKITSESLNIKLRKLIKTDVFNMHDFWIYNGFSTEEILSITRKREIRAARQVGITWAVMSGMSLSDAGRLFCKDHSTAFHSMKVVVLAMEMPNHFPEVHRVVERVRSSSNVSGMSITRDSNAAMLINLENILNQINPEMFKK